MFVQFGFISSYILRSKFEEYDLDKNGTLDYSEVEQCLRNLNVKPHSHSYYSFFISYFSYCLQTNACTMILSFPDSPPPPPADGECGFTGLVPPM